MEPQRQGESRFDQRARDLSLADLSDVISLAREILGPKLIAYIGQATHTRTVQAWIDGSVALSPQVQRRLRATGYAASLLHEREGKATIQSWFAAMVPDLDDESPAELLRDVTLVDAVVRVEEAARSFWVNG